MFYPPAPGRFPPPLSPAPARSVWYIDGVLTLGRRGEAVDGSSALAGRTSPLYLNYYNYRAAQLYSREGRRDLRGRRTLVLVDDIVLLSASILRCQPHKLGECTPAPPHRTRATVPTTREQLPPVDVVVRTRAPRTRDWKDVLRGDVEFGEVPVQDFSSADAQSADVVLPLTGQSWSLTSTRRAITDSAAPRFARRPAPQPVIGPTGLRLVGNCLPRR
jgi:hypothetical protein